jgi:TrpR-related protein YerC/YecD
MIVRQHSAAAGGEKAKAYIPLEKAFLLLRTPEEVRRFLKDICTPAEIEALHQRWLVAQMLEEKKLSYREIHEASGASITTVARVARFLFQEDHRGYELVLTRAKEK